MENTTDMDLAKGSLELIRKDLRLTNDAKISEADPLGDLRAFLKKEISYLLDHDFGGLLNAMYRIDISEEVVTRILNLSKPGQLIDNLTDAIIERECKKVESRRRYGGFG